MKIEPTAEAAERIAAEALQHGMAVPDYVAGLLWTRSRDVSTVADRSDLIDTQVNAASIALLRSWLTQDATDDAEAVAEADDELARFKAAINADRERAGARLIYP